MKKKTINAIITKKINEWLDSITDKDLATKIRSDIVVTGGCITSMLLNEEVNDFDVYFKSKETVKAVAQYYCNKFNDVNQNKANHVGRKLHAWVLDGLDVEAWKAEQIKLSEFAHDYPDIPYKEILGWVPGEGKVDAKHLNVSGMVTNTMPDRIKIMVNSDGIAEDSDSTADSVDYDVNEYVKAVGEADEVPANEAEETEKYKPIFLSTNAITLSNKIQIIIRFYGSPEEIHENYDFVHATNYWTHNEGVVLKQEALEAIMNKDLVYIGSKYPICSLVRTRKFIKRGWNINAGQFVKISFQISELDLTNIYVLEDQLVGVDSIYFLKFVEALKIKQAREKDFQLSQTYLTSVIDKIFG